ncbi:MAG: glutathione S-transferase C-terminal domain-containing protein [Deltaproteobacteria bacterium]|nr:glutathione S-transferase C-terminal domain-containing protein [Deltaproteobacteria bacterium]
MGQLVDGVWRTGWYEPDAKGAFQRPPTRFRNGIDGPAPGRYHLYVSHACPWAHRTVITRSLRGLERVVSMTVLDPRMPDEGWAFRAEDPDPFGTSGQLPGKLQDVYRRNDPKYTGRVTVPVLWDRKTATIVNNESRDIMRMLDLDFAPTAEEPLEPSLAPDELRADVDRVLDAIYGPINNGVYRAGFAHTQAAYEAAAHELFDALAYWDGVLATQPYLCGERMTEADIALFTTLLRFDLVYYSHFKCNLRRLRDHANLWRLTRRMYQHPGIRPTCQLDDIKAHYYWSQPTVNPTRIIPLGPDLEPELSAPVDG